MKPPALHGFCSFSSLGMRMAKQISRRKISNIIEPSTGKVKENKVDSTESYL